MKSPRSSDEIEKIRENIIDASLAVIVEEGFTSFTMRRLATRMRMTAPNLYNYFKSKDEIYISIVINGFRMLKDELGEAYRNTRSPAGRARAMMRAYVRFGIANKAYYDIMFTRSTPKYNDYVGTPYEKLSAIEMKLSMDIAELAIGTLKDIRKKAPMPDDETIHHIVKLWSLLHGMVSLSNSNIVGYVAQDIEKTYNRIINELIEEYRVS
jgi:AcrR family transcriptional regulator